MADSTATPPPPPRPPHEHSRRPNPSLRNLPGYEIEGELGRGGMGVVYLARQVELNRRVALKMLSGHYGDEELQRFRAEAETAAGLHHTNIAHIYEVGEHEGAPFYSLEYVEGGSLADLLRTKPPELRTGVELLIRVARALHFAHQNGVVHRDMKPANVLLDAEGVPKVADFGIAKRLKDQTKLTLSGAVVGTPTYMAPEQAKGTSRDVGAAADIYSLGAILYEILTGRPPFLPEESETAMTVRVLTEDPVSPAYHRPGIPRDLETICMKCLEKQPPDRYASAADLADDLRRFLDDESILARPPTRATRTLKWSKRHPWHTSLVLALLVAGGFGLQRLWRWEFYQRPRVEWAMGLDFIDGGAEPTARLSEAQTRQRDVSLRFTRHGRRGKIARVEALNPHGNPASFRRVTGADVLPNLLEGPMGAQKQEERKRETLQLDFVYSGDTLVETIASDRNKRVTWRLLWDRASAAQGDRRIARARFVDLRGFDFATTQGASHTELIRDEQGRDLEIRFFNGRGQPAPNAEEVFGYRVQRRGDGLVEELTNLGKDGNPGENRLGMISLKLDHNAQRLVTGYTFADGRGGAQPWNGVAAIALDYDALGNLTATRRLDGAGKPTNGTGDADSWCDVTNRRNSRGEILEIAQRRVASDGALVPSQRTEIEYDGFGYVASLKVTAAEPWQRRFVNDRVGNVIEERILDGEGKTVAGPGGWAIARYVRTNTTSPPGWREEETFFDADGNKAYSESGHHHGINEFDASGHFKRLINEDHDPARFRFYRVISEPEFDQQSRMRRLNMRMEDAQGQAIKTNDSYSAIDSEFNEDQRKVREWTTGWNVEIFGASVWRTETEYYANGSIRRKVQQACDEARQPLSVLPTGDPAMILEEFSGIGRLEHLLETGFHEQLVGFSQREARLVEGQLQSVTHRSADGSVVAPVHAVVKGFYADAQAPAAQMRVGDRLLTANGLAIGSTLEWTIGFNFPGGWIEVLRDGERIRIDGFEAGKLGVALEDRK